jgi:surfactin synthase thioesterase subunit
MLFKFDLIVDPCYRDWDENFPEYEFSLIIYPGRAARFGEKLLSTIKEYVTQLQIHLLPNITKPCIFIGHR